MEQQDNTNKTPYNELTGQEQLSRLDAMVRSAYFRRNRQLPANLADIVATLKADLLKYLGGIPVWILDESITTSTLDNDAQLSPAFFFAAAKKAWFQPKTNVHNWEAETTRNDTENDTIALLDTCAAIVKAQDADQQADDPNKPLKGCLTLPAFNARREFQYLKLRGQLTPQNANAKLNEAIEAVNRERIRDNRHRVNKDKALDDKEVVAMCMRLAVIDWLRACNTNGTKPSEILTPLIDETQYQYFMREV